MSCHFHDKKVFPYAAKELYGIVADVKNYPSFLPGTLAATILEEGPGFMRAELSIGAAFMKASYTSKVLLDPPHRVDVVYEQGPFKDLKSYWIFHPLGDKETEVEFFIDFSFKSRFLQKAMEGMFQEGIQDLMEAFEKRAKELLG